MIFICNSCKHKSATPSVRMLAREDGPLAKGALMAPCMWECPKCGKVFTGQSLAKLANKLMEKEKTYDG